MTFLDTAHTALLRRFIRDFDRTDDPRVRTRYGMAAGGLTAAVISVLFVVKVAIGAAIGSPAVIADAFHLLSYLADAIVVLASFWLASRPATVRTPFGQGRMEYVVDLVMAMLLLISGFRIAESGIRQILNPGLIKYEPVLFLVLLGTAPVTVWLMQVVIFIGKRINSAAVGAIALHYRANVLVSLVVIGGLVAEHRLGIPEIDGWLGLAVSLGLLYIGFHHGREAVIPILGKAPNRAMLREIRNLARSVDGVEDVHEIIVHDYGSMYLISLHAEIPETYGPASMHEIAERCEAVIRRRFGGETVCHTDPLLQRTPELDEVETMFRKELKNFPRITGYHDFRIIAESPERFILVADIDVEETVPDRDYERIASGLNKRIREAMPHVAYCSFYITPKFAY
jgi:cation diffusion facilitator family transporter